MWRTVMMSCFLKDTDGDGKADHREVILSGFGTEDTHHIVHTFQVGPGRNDVAQSVDLYSYPPGYPLWDTQTTRRWNVALSSRDQADGSVHEGFG